VGVHDAAPTNGRNARTHRTRRARLLVGRGIRNAARNVCENARSRAARYFDHRFVDHAVSAESCRSGGPAGRPRQPRRRWSRSRLRPTARRCVRSLEWDSRRLEIGEARCRNARRVLRLEPTGRRGDPGVPAAKLRGDRRCCSRCARSSPADRLTISRDFSSGLSAPNPALESHVSGLVSEVDRTRSLLRSPRSSPVLRARFAPDAQVDGRGALGARVPVLRRGLNRWSRLGVNALGVPAGGGGRLRTPRRPSPSK